jgi:hypothetical protein
MRHSYSPTSVYLIYVYINTPTRLREIGNPKLITPTPLRLRPSYEILVLKRSHSNGNPSLNRRFVKEMVARSEAFSPPPGSRREQSRRRQRTTDPSGPLRPLLSGQ